MTPAFPTHSRNTRWLSVLMVTIGLMAIMIFAAAAAPAAARGGADYSGKVTFNGTPVPGASVTVTRDAQRITVTTDLDGIYRFTDLAEGTWSLTIEMLGFAAVRREIQVPPPSDVPAVELEVLPFDELQRHATPQLSSLGATDSSNGATTVASETAETSSTPAAAERVESDAKSVDSTGIGAAAALLINGSLNNGASTQFAQARGFGNNRPNPRAVRTYALGIQFGDSSLDARPYSISGAPVLEPSYTNAQGLAMFEGPVRVPGLRNRMRVFLGFQSSADTNVTTQWARVPTDLERVGDFSRTLDPAGNPVQIIDPATGRPFTGNAIGADQISPQARALLDYYPRAGAETPGRFNYQAPRTTEARQSNLQSRAAYSISSRSDLTVSASYERTAADTTSLFGFEDASDTSTLDAQATWSLRLTRFHSLHLRYHYLRNTNESVPYFANRINVSRLAGIGGNDDSPLNWGPPSLAFGSDLAGLTDGNYLSGNDQRHAWAVESTWLRGPHKLTIGGEAGTINNDVFGQQNPRGGFSFTGAATGVDFADFLLGLPRTSSIAFGNPDKYFRGRTYAAYIEDDWRVGSTLTVNIGARWEYESPISEARDRLVNLDVAPNFSAVSPTLPDGTGALTGQRYPAALLRPDWSGLQPRVSVAWRRSGGSSLVFRAGYGIYRNTNVYQPIATLLAQQPPLSTTFDIETSDAHPLTLANGFFPIDALPRNTFAVDPDFRVGMAQTWHMSVQRSLPYSLTIVTSYVGTKGSRLMQQFLPNTYPMGAANPCPACPAGFRYLTSGGRSIRHAGQVQVRRRLSNGFAASVEYTLAKAMDDAAAFAGASIESSALAQDWTNLDAEYARSNQDQRHVLAIGGEYSLGAGFAGERRLHGWKGRLLKEWTFAGNLAAGSGLPITPVYFVPVSGTGIVGPVRPDLVGDPHDAVSGSYANPASFAPPRPGQWGNAPRNSINGPRTFSLNASIARTFRVGDRLNFDWRLDATNVLNTVTYAAVNPVITSPQFGRPTRANDMRRFRIGILVRF